MPSYGCALLLTYFIMKKIVHLTWNSFSLICLSGIPGGTSGLSFFRATCAHSLTFIKMTLIYKHSFSSSLGSISETSRHSKRLASSSGSWECWEDHSSSGPKYVWFKAAGEAAGGSVGSIMQMPEIGWRTESSLKDCIYVKIYEYINMDPVKPGRIGEKDTNPGIVFFWRKLQSCSVTILIYLFEWQWVLEMQG